ATGLLCPRDASRLPSPIDIQEFASRSRLCAKFHVLRPPRRKFMCASPAARSSLILLWAGEDPAFYQTLTDSLNAAGIPSRNMAIGDDSITADADPLPIDWKPRFGFEVAVLSADMTAAKQILEKLLSQEPEDLEIPEQPLAVDEERPLTEETESHPKVEIW